MDLGKKRANFIIQTLVKLGVPSTLLQAESEGEHVLPSKEMENHWIYLENVAEE